MEIKKYSDYGGTIISPENRNQYKKTMKDYFIERTQLEYNKRKSDIENSENTDDKKQEMLSKLELDTPIGEYLDQLSDNFAIYQSTKETKHFKAWLKGHKNFKYKGQTFPVLTKDVTEKDFLQIDNIENLESEQE